MYRSSLYIILLGTMLCTVAATCERPVELDIELPPPRLVVSGNFQPGELLEITVSKSQSILEDELQDEFVSMALVEVYEDEVFAERLEFIPRGTGIHNYPYYQSKVLKPKIGSTYKIEVHAPEFDPVSAFSMIPEPVQITDFAIFDPVSGPGSLDGQIRYAFDVFINFADPVHEDNFYHINFYQQVNQYELHDQDTLITNTLIYPVEFSGENNNNYAESYFGGGILLEDNPFQNGFGFQLGVELDPRSELLGKVLVELRTVSEDYYLYYQSVNRQLSQGGALSEPVHIYNNIENGHGIFAGYSLHQDSISVPPL